MKKALLTICLAAASLTSFAQFYGDYEAPVTFGIKGGANFASFQQSVEGLEGSASSGSVIGYHAGVYANFNIDYYFAIQPALLFTVKGSKFKYSESTEIEDIGTVSVLSDDKATLNYLHFPVNLIYKVPTGDNKFFFGAGPFISYGLSGKAKTKQTGTLMDETFTNEVEGDVTFGNEPGNVKRFDYGANALVGFKFYGGFVISANYDFGLAEIQNNTDDETGITTKVKTRVIGLSIGYEF
ncbi:PorT family protein [Mucilaginibacter limnophilus]|uniref:PorT family protein n=1 Tax=Mucilaginibacter limnophilus TaxID=1932778 RepID=A0A437MK99_9SPHI|nr:porin family protein [Mucilaginibacter limnophilus]RVT98080.1 PorT family protein [Mucilaginibacter limnophilus]